MNIVAILPEEPTTETTAPAPKRRRWLRRWAILLGIVVAVLLWLSGPGFRLFAPRIGIHYLERLGLRGKFVVHGNLTGNVSFSDVVIESDGAVTRLEIAKVKPGYRWKGLYHGEIDALELEGVHLTLRLDPEKITKEDQPVDLALLNQLIRDARNRWVPLKFAANDMTIDITRNNQLVMRMASGRATHEAGSDLLHAELGAVTGANGYQAAAQATDIRWLTDAIQIDRLDPLPGVSLREFTLQTPPGGMPSLDSEVHLDDAMFVISTSPGFSDATADLREGKLDMAPFFGRFGIALGWDGTLTSFAIQMDHVLSDPLGAKIEMRSLVENAQWQGWQATQLSLDANLTDSQLSSNLHVSMLDSEATITAHAPLSRVKGSIEVGDVAGEFTIPNAPAALQGLAVQVPEIDRNANVPASSTTGTFAVDLEGGLAKAIDVDARLNPVDPEKAAPVDVKWRWVDQKPMTLDVVTDGLKGSGTYDIKSAQYQATVALDHFASTRIDPWLAAAKVVPPGKTVLTGTWNGTGDVKTQIHRGEVVLQSAQWDAPDRPPVSVSGGLRYQWPGSFQTHNLRVETNGQQITADVSMADGLLVVPSFLWSANGQELADGKASLPAPADFTAWRDTLAHDTRPLAISVHSRVLPLSSLKTWLPQLGDFDPQSTAEVSVEISGSYVEPIIDAKLEARDLRSPLQPKLPPTDLKLVLTGREGKLNLEGEATAPDFAPAVIKATLPFRPAEWAANPGSVRDEPIDARVDLPRLELSRFAALIPEAIRASGTLNGYFTATGKVGEPVIAGSLDLTGGAVKFADEHFPEVTALTMSIDAVPEKITLKSIRGSVGGGTISGEGTLAIDQGKPGAITAHAKGDHLPIVRNDYLIVRTNGDLTLQGTWDRATISGTLGVVDSLFYRDIEILPIGRPFTGPAPAELPDFATPQVSGAAFPEPIRNWGLNVTVRTERPVLIRGNLALGEITGSARVGGTVGSPAPDGVFKVKDLKASLPFNTLTVPNGTATFTPATGFDPILDLHGVAEPRPYIVNMYVSGRASDPQMFLTSSPPLPENEIMTLLATGTTTTGLEDPQAAASRALQLLVEELRRGRFRFGQKLRPVLKLLDNVEFSLAEADPYSSESFSTANVRLNDRFYLSAGVGSDGNSRGLLIWRLNFR